MFPENEQPNGNCTGNWFRTRRSFISVMNVMPAYCGMHGLCICTFFPTRCELIFPLDTAGFLIICHLLSRTLFHCSLLVGPVQWQNWSVSFWVFAGAITPFHPLVCACLQDLPKENSFVILLLYCKKFAIFVCTYAVLQHKLKLDETYKHIIINFQQCS